MVSDTPAGDGKIYNLFLQCNRLNKMSGYRNVREDEKRVKHMKGCVNELNELTNELMNKCINY